MIGFSRRFWSLLPAVSLGLGATHCSRSGAFECSSASDCGGEGRCESTGFCSFPDPGCESGHRYGEFADSLSNQCVTIADGSSGGTSIDVSDPTTSGPSTTDSLPPTVDPTQASTSSSVTNGGISDTAATETTSSATTDPIDGSEGTDGFLECTLQDFDALPGPPQWVLYGDATVRGSALVLESSPAGSPMSGVRTDTPLDFTIGRATLRLLSIPDTASAATSFYIFDEPPSAEFALGFTISGDELRAEQLSDGKLQVLNIRQISAAQFPLDLLIETDGEQLRLSVISQGLATGTEGELLLVDQPPITATAYFNVGTENPGASAIGGTVRADFLELCPEL